MDNLYNLTKFSRTKKKERGKGRYKTKSSINRTKTKSKSPGRTKTKSKSPKGRTKSPKGRTKTKLSKGRLVINNNIDNYNQYLLENKLKHAEHPLADYPMNELIKLEEKYQKQQNELFRDFYLNNAQNQANYIFEKKYPHVNETFDYDEYNIVFPKRRSYNIPIGDFDILPENVKLVNGTTENKLIVQIRGHGVICNYNSFKEKIIEDPTQDIIRRTNIFDFLGNIQLLSTQTIGRYGTKSFEKIFYELIKKYSDFYNAVLDVKTQEEANNLNKLFTYFLKQHNILKLRQILLAYYNDTNLNNDIVNFRIYPKNLRPREPLNSLLAFWPSSSKPLNSEFYKITEEHIRKYGRINYDRLGETVEERKRKFLEEKTINNLEVNGIYDYTKKNPYGYYDVYNLLMEHEYEIKKCFLQQYKDAFNNDLIIRCSLLLPDKDTTKKLEAFLNSKQINIENYFECIRYNYYIYDLLSRDNIDLDKDIRYRGIRLNTLAMYIHALNIQKQSDILLVDNSCKGFYHEPIKPDKKRRFNLVTTNLDEPDFDYKSALKAKREASVNGEESTSSYESTYNELVRELFLNYQIFVEPPYSYKIDTFNNLYEQNIKLNNILEKKITDEYQNYATSDVDFLSDKFYKIRKDLYECKYRLHLLYKIFEYFK